MYCVFCNAFNTKVINSRLLGDGSKIRRRRECTVCHERFTTFEIAVLVMPFVVKNNNIRELFNEDKIRKGMQKALEKLSVSSDVLETAINNVKLFLRKTGEQEISSNIIGKIVMAELKKIDKVAYIRFVSVYRNFADIREFCKEIATLQD
ncbi:transcriptional regulator NrdR [Arsenophonus symbiont of Ornithomya chloropus]|uniref:transcriptional regulator NrdR n=1 Tax=Arsenophonus symbiont of Ornithomya chloropus TaxID=634121 RepID=UPI0032B21519